MLQIMLFIGLGAVFAPTLSKSQGKEAGDSTETNNPKIILFETLTAPPSFFMEREGKLYSLRSSASEYQDKSAFLRNDELDVKIQSSPPGLFFYPNLRTKNITLWLEERFLYMGIVIQAPIFVKAIHFDSDSDLIRNDASAELDKLSKLMADHPNTHVSITAYTDARGSVSHNEQLAKKRAESTLRYLLESRVDINRITIKTSQASSFKNVIGGVTLSNEEIHRMNRRAEFHLTLDNTNQ